jgi:hypothetical protein
MNSLKEFYGTILILLTKNTFSITTYAWIDRSNRIEFIPKRFELSEIERERERERERECLLV